MALRRPHNGPIPHNLPGAGAGVDGLDAGVGNDGLECGRADAGAIGSPFWNTVSAERLVPEGALTEVWSSPAYNHCMFTARPDFDLEREHRFVKALFGMSYDNPVHRPILEAEGLQRWLPPHVDGYAALRQAASEQGFFKPLFAKTA